MFICFEGIDGSGKSTHIPYFSGQLKKRLIDVVLTREPGGTQVGDALRNIFLHHELNIDSEIMLAFSARQAHIQQVILPALKKQQWVLSDRFVDSTYAYQGYGKYGSFAFIEYLHQNICQMLYADCTILFDIDPFVAQQRRIKRSSNIQINASHINNTMSLDVFEKQALDFHVRVRDGYLKIFEQRCAKNHLYFMINTDDTIQNIQYQLDEIIDKLVLC